jgi:hypothetical protein
MHHYTSVTSKTFLGDPRLSENIWSRSAPLLAFEGEGRAYLADAIMAVAALHLRSLHPEDKALVRASHEYAASTLTEYCASLERGITADLSSRRLTHLRQGRRRGRLGRPQRPL